MTTSVVSHLIRKDLRLQRTTILLSMAVGIASLGVVQRGGEVPIVLGSVWFFISLIVLGTMLPIASIVNERKKQNLPFLMSLPVSSFQYSIAKMISGFVMFLLPWLMLSLAALLVIEGRSVLPHGAIPMICVLALMPVLAFCLISGAALVGESEGWSMAATLICNSSYGLAWYLLARSPSIHGNWSSHTAIWSGAVLRVLFIEIGLTVLIVGLTLFVQSRKRNFI